MGSCTLAHYHYMCAFFCSQRTQTQGAIPTWQLNFLASLNNLPISSLYDKSNRVSRSGDDQRVVPLMAGPTVLVMGSQKVVRV
jgi:hypothetical protein